MLRAQSSPDLASDSCYMRPQTALIAYSERQLAAWAAWAASLPVSRLWLRPLFL
jgi:hypothetical protein